MQQRGQGDTVKGYNIDNVVHESTHQRGIPFSTPFLNSLTGMPTAYYLPGIATAADLVLQPLTRYSIIDQEVVPMRERLVD